MSTHHEPPSLFCLSTLAEGKLENRYGKFDYYVFTDGCQDALVLSTEKLRDRPPINREVICRIHSSCVSSHMFFSRGCDCVQQMEDTLYEISKNKEKMPGVVILLDQEGKGNGIAAYVATLKLRAGDPAKTEAMAYQEAGFPDDQRRYDIAAKILHFFSARRIRLVSDNQGKIEALTKHFDVAPQNPSQIVHLGPACRSLIARVRAGRSRNPVGANNGGRVIVVGDLNIDYRFNMQEWIQDPIVSHPTGVVGGTAFNAALAFLQNGLQPVLVGSIGNDREGREIADRLQATGLRSMIRVRDDQPTGRCQIIKHEFPELFQGQNRVLIKTGDSANTYDLDDFQQAIDLLQPCSKDTVFIVAHSLERLGSAHLAQLIRIAHGPTRPSPRTTPKIVLDLVPHDIFNKRDWTDLRRVLDAGVDVLITELHTLWRLRHDRSTGVDWGKFDWTDLGRDDAKMLDLRKGLRVKKVKLVVRYGFGHCEFQRVVSGSQVSSELVTGYSKSIDVIGFGDSLTGKLLKSGAI